MATLSQIQHAFEKRLKDNYLSTPIAWDNVSFSPPSSGGWIRPTLLPVATKNASLGLSKRYSGIFWIQVFAPLLSGSKLAYEIAEELEVLFSNKQFDEVVCYASEITRTGNEGKGWFQLNVKVHFWSHEIN